MSDSEKLIAKYAAQVLQGKKVGDLTFEELQLTDLLVKHGYMRAATHGFNGIMTEKAMIRENVPVQVKFEGSNVKRDIRSYEDAEVGVSHLSKGLFGRYGPGRFG